MNTGYIVLILIIILGLGWYFLGQTPEGAQIPIESEFDTKVVYTTETSTSTEPFIADCNERGGTFNECGTICEPEAEACAAVCAFTCDDIPASGANGTTTQDGDAMMEKDEDGAMMEGKDEGAMMEKPDVTVDLTGRNFAFNQDTITVNEGDVVKVNFESTDGTHDFVVDEFDAKTDRVSTGETTSVTFVAETAGEYAFYCSVGNHRERGMEGTLIVE